MGAIIAVVHREGEDASKAAVTMLKMLAHKSAKSFGIASPTTVRKAKTIASLQNKDIDSPVIVGHVFSQILPQDKPQPTKLKNATLVFEGRIHPKTAETSDAEVAAKKLDQEESAEELVKEFDGGFAFAVAEQGKIVAGRDAVGIYPFYYGMNRSFVALASERKALWTIGIKTVNSFPPGHVAYANEKGFRFQTVKTLTCAKAKQITMETAVKRLQRYLQHSVKEKVSDLREVAVAFSGGLDSSIIAFLAKKSGVNVHLIYVSLENQPETKYAQEASEELNLPMHVSLYKEEDVAKTISKVLWLIEEPDLVKTSIGVPFYWTSEKAAEMKFNVLLAGQGADELFGGYRRYVDDYLRHDGEKVRRLIINDILKMYEINFERDFKICNFHNVDLRLPFATYPISKFATELPIELKLERKENGLRKLVLRQVAKNLGLPKFIVEKPKKAIQYATGVNKILKRLAAQQGLTAKEYVEKTFSQFSRRMSKYD
jgi:asparagine synthase (glutamine-hydrolysing)